MIRRFLADRRVRLGLTGFASLLMLGTCREVRGTAEATDETVRVVVPRGASLRAVADSLAAHAIIASPRLFRWYATRAGEAGAIKPGSYAFAEGSGYAVVLEALVRGAGILRTVVIPEGFDLRAITPLLAKALDVPEDSVEAAVTDPTLLARLELPTTSLEGYLFPATYSFAAGTSARDAIATMVARWESAWKPEWDAWRQARSLSRHAVMTMASIVEKEAQQADERPIIAAVYWNRVRKGMKLQADPTVQYALPRHVGRVLYKDLTVDSRYNTYKYAGLPPGPIASPGEAAIAATLAPAKVPYLFFVARGDGGHEFRTTFREHAAAIRAVRAAKAASARAADAKADTFKAPAVGPSRP